MKNVNHFNNITICCVRNCRLKMPEHWCALPCHTLMVSIILTQKSFQHSIHTILSWQRMYTGRLILNSKNYIFQPVYLNLWPWPSNSCEIWSNHATCAPSLGFSRQMVHLWECWQTDACKHTYPLTGPIVCPGLQTRKGITILSCIIYTVPHVVLKEFKKIGEYKM